MNNNDIFSKIFNPEPLFCPEEISHPFSPLQKDAQVSPLQQIVEKCICTECTAAPLNTQPFTAAIPSSYSEDELLISQLVHGCFCPEDSHSSSLALSHFSPPSFRAPRVQDELLISQLVQGCFCPEDAPSTSSTSSSSPLTLSDTRATQRRSIKKSKKISLKKKIALPTPQKKRRRKVAKKSTISTLTIS